MSNYSKTTDFEAKDSLPTGDSGKIIRGAEFETEFDAISTAIATKADTAGPTFTGTLTFETISDGTIGVTAFVDEDDMSSDSATLVPTQQSVKAYVDSQVTAQDLDFQADSGGALSIDLDSETLTFTGGTGVDTSGSGNAVTFAIDSTVATLTGTQTLTNKTLTAPTISGNLTTDGTIDGRDVATDGAKLDGIESGATADQTAAEIRTLVDSASDSNVFTDADHTKLDGIEASADVTDTTNVTAAGAVMDSELTSEASVKALNQGVATTDSPTFAGVTVNGTVEFDGLSGTGAVSVTDILDQDDMSSNSATALATQQSIKAYVDTTVAATNELVEDTTPQLGGDLASNGNDILFADNDKAIFGAGSDLEIYSDGSTSYIREAGPGNLRIAGAGVQITDTSFNKYFLGSGDVARLYHSDDEKLATTSTGIDVTGTASVDGLTVSGVAYIQSTTTPQLELAYNSVNITGFYRSGGDFQIKNDNGAGTPETSIVLAEDGAVTLYHDASAKLATTATGIDVTGTVTADGLTVDKEGTDHLKITDTSSSNALTVGIGNTVGTVAIDPTDSVASSKLDFSIDGNTAIRIAEGGDISFYEDTGTTAKLTWSAADESLQIGTVLPQTVSGLVSRENGPAVEWGHGNRTSGYYGTLGTQYTNGQPYLSFSCDADSSGNTFTTRGFKGNVLLGTSTGDLTFNQLTNADASGQNLTERMRIDSSGLVGIGTSSPQNLLHVNKSDSLASAMQFTNSTTGATSSDGVFVGLGSGEQGYFWNYEANDLILGTSNAERMRIDSSGNLLVGKTNNTLSNDGTIIRAGGEILVTNTSDFAGTFNRLSTDGAIVGFAKDGTTVGSIGSEGGDSLFIVSDDTGLRVSGVLDSILPCTAAGAARDDVIDLGLGSARFDNIYATNGTIQTSDRNEKQDIEALSDAEQRVAVACKGLLRKFRWKSSVSENGDEARIHFGIIAQDLQSAFEAEGLDAGRYAMFISTTWTDEETGEERTRMGVRYSELLAFIIAAI